ncbi:hypothetical protein ACJJIF_21240 [Microbulbifer sp. SSSA002]|uniref:hypothetical protein n=1 Tax=unclassified Microbulbifer TaxID=2619833 RepID=UPI00403983A4
MRPRIEYGFSDFMADINPAVGIKRFEEKKRDRYLTDGGLKAISSKANPTIKLVMDMCYLTTQRISEVLAIQLQRHQQREH